MVVGVGRVASVSLVGRLRAGQEPFLEVLKEVNNGVGGQGLGGLLLSQEVVDSSEGSDTEEGGAEDGADVAVDRCLAMVDGVGVGLDVPGVACLRRVHTGDGPEGDELSRSHWQFLGEDHVADGLDTAVFRDNVAREGRASLAKLDSLGVNLFAETLTS